MKNIPIRAGLTQPIVPLISPTDLELRPIKEINEFGPFSDFDIEGLPTFQETFNDDSVVFYQLRKYNFERLVYIERGTGHVKGDNFVREHVNARGPDLLELRYTENTAPKKIHLAPDECIVLLSDAPNDYKDALRVPNSVISSSEHSVQLTQLPPNSLFGRLNDGVEAVTFEELENNPAFCSMIRRIMGRVPNMEGVHENT